MGITIGQQNETNAITLEGVVDIACAVELKQALVQALGSGSRTLVSVAGASWLDVNILQLLWAAERAATKAGAAFEIADELAEPVAAALQQCGFEPLAATVKHT